MIDDATLRFWLDDCTYKDWYFYLGRDGDQPWLQVHFVAHCARTGRREEQAGRKWRLSRHMTKSEVVQTALKAVLTAVEHEARESFMYKGRAIYHPHWSVDRLVTICDETTASEERGLKQKESQCAD